MDTPQDLLTILLGLAQSHEVRAHLTVKDDLVSGTITVRPKRSSCVGVRAGGPSCRVDGPVTPREGDSSTGPSATRPTPQCETDHWREEAREAWKLLKEIGVDQHTATKLATLYPIARVREVTAAANKQRSPSGWAITALQGGWKVKPTND